MLAVPARGRKSAGGALLDGAGGIPPTSIIEYGAPGPYLLPMLECRFPRAVGSLDAIFAFVHQFIADRSLDPELAYDLDLIIEELFTNLVKYGRDGRNDILVALDADPAKITVMLRDFDVEGFDPTQAKPVDTAAPLDERRPGGLGIHFVKRIADDVQYDYTNRTVTLTVTKRLSS
jgi:serine/threonine-protein kinase RsbW